MFFNKYRNIALDWQCLITLKYVFIYFKNHNAGYILVVKRCRESYPGNRELPHQDSTERFEKTPPTRRSKVYLTVPFVTYILQNTVAGLLEITNSKVLL